jgi:putative ABC transport system permease protein
LSITLWLSSLRYLIGHPWQVGLAVLGVSLGVAVVVSIDLANQSAKRAFRCPPTLSRGEQRTPSSEAPADCPKTFTAG